MRPFPAHKLTWWICRTCNSVQVYTASDLHEIKGGIPMCNSCEDGVGYFMHRVDFETESGENHETIGALRSTIGELEEHLRDLLVDYLNTMEQPDVNIDEDKTEITPLDHETYGRVISALRMDVDDRNRHINELNDEIKKLKADAKDAHARAGTLIDNQACKLVKNNTAIKEFESDIRELRASRGRQTETIRDLMNDLQQKDMVTIQLVEKLASHDETIRVMRNTNGALDRNLQDRNVRLDHMRDVVDNPRGRSFQAIVERISNIIREDEP